MRILMDVPNGVFATYEAYGVKEHILPEDAMRIVLTRFAHVPHDMRVLVLLHADLTRLEKMLGLGSLQTAEQLVERTERLAKLDIGGIEVPWTAGQLEELKSRAAKNNLTPDELAKNIVRDMASLFFTHV